MKDQDQFMIQVSICYDSRFTNYLSLLQLMKAHNAIIRSWGLKRVGPKLKNHVELLGIADTKKGANVAGGRGFYLKGDGAHLNQALINFGLDFLEKRGYTSLQTPFFMRKDIMAKCAQLGQFDEELYKVTGEGEDKYLIATAEQPICAYHLDDWIHPSQLAIRYMLDIHLASAKKLVHMVDKFLESSEFISKLQTFELNHLSKKSTLKPNKSIAFKSSREESFVTQESDDDLDEEELAFFAKKFSKFVKFRKNNESGNFSSLTSGGKNFKFRDNEKESSIDKSKKSQVRTVRPDLCWLYLRDAVSTGLDFELWNSKCHGEREKERETCLGMASSVVINLAAYSDCVFKKILVAVLLLGCGWFNSWFGTVMVEVLNSGFAGLWMVFLQVFGCSPLSSYSYKKVKKPDDDPRCFEFGLKFEHQLVSGSQKICVLKLDRRNTSGPPSRTSSSYVHAPARTTASASTSAFSVICMNAFSDGGTAFESTSPNHRRGVAAEKGESAQAVFRSLPPEQMKTSVSRCMSGLKL
ncbi:hypothetical protein RHGRI_029613 [Rhododendron griersonianum]|uniref:Uncharacterized protein n=1 Tax=Rhododendron griersonianum TaxID=479676 RepID=A0AAV6IQH1_9ERIC|nr:hypothetical protein RHGRI_029613 [Rhododendron griersonianum]